MILTSWSAPGGTAPCLDACPTPTLLGETASASLTKGGFTEFAGHASTPPKYYLKSVYNHTGNQDAANDIVQVPAANYYHYTATENVDFTRTSEYALVGGALVLTVTPSGGSSNSFSTDSGLPDSTTGSSCSQPDESCFSLFCGACQNPIDTSGCGPAPTSSGSAATTTVTATSSVTSGYFSDCSWSCVTSGSPGGSNTGHCNASEESSTVLSEEYTTAMLIAATEAALPALPGTFTGVPTASRDLSTNEATYSLAQGQYKFRFPAPGGCCFTIAWVERFVGEADDGTPLPPVDTAKSYVYPGGCAPAGYNPADPTTWPETPVYSLPIPLANGETTVAAVTVDCTCGS